MGVGARESHKVYLTCIHAAIRQHDVIYSYHLASRCHRPLEYDLHAIGFKQNMSVISSAFV